LPPAPITSEISTGHYDNVTKSGVSINIKTTSKVTQTLEGYRYAYMITNGSSVTLGVLWSARHEKLFGRVGIEMNPMTSQELIFTYNSLHEIMVDAGIDIYLGKQRVATGWAPAYVPQQ